MADKGDRSPPPRGPGWDDLSTGMKILWLLSGLLALLLGIGLGVYLTYS